MSKYEPLRAYLETRKTEAVPMTFAEIEKVVGFKLPKSQVYPAWWSNNPTNNVMTREWIAAGYKTEQVDIEGRKLVFRRTKPAAPAGGGFAEAPAASKAKQPRRHPSVWVDERNVHDRSRHRFDRAGRPRLGRHRRGEAGVRRKIGG